MGTRVEWMHLGRTQAHLLAHGTYVGDFAVDGEIAVAIEHDSTVVIEGDRAQLVAALRALLAELEGPAAG